MRENIKERVLKEADILIKHKITIRELSKIIGVSKSTVHQDMKVRLKNINKDLYLEVKYIFLEHTKVRHLLGGLSTKKKYKKNTIK